MKILTCLFGFFVICKAAFTNYNFTNNCVPRDPPVNGYVTPDDRYYIPGDQIAFVCNEGYLIRGVEKDICQKGATWKLRDTPSCEPKCFERTPPDNGTVHPPHKYYAVGELIEFSCDSGFELIGKKNDECVGVGSWLFDNTPLCLPFPRCRSRNSPKNGSVTPNFEYYTPGDQITFKCDPNYPSFVLSGSKQDYCQENGTWRINEDPYCRKTCFSLLPERHGVISPEKEFYFVGDEVIMSCLPGFRLDGGAKTKCEQDGWSNLPSALCITACLKPPAPLHGAVYPIKKFYNPGSVIEYFCDVDYKLVGRKKDDCSKTEWFYGEIPRCTKNNSSYPRRCGNRVAPDNGYVTPYLRYYYQGSKIIFGCHEGYSLDGANKDVCGKGGMWKINKAPLCYPTCFRRTPPENGMVGPSFEIYRVGFRITFHCLPGFKLIGNKHDECVGVNRWLVDNTPRCLPEIMCYSKRPPDNGTIFPIRTYFLPGEQIRYKCDLGFYLEGSTYDDCQKDGTWRIKNVTLCKPYCSPPLSAYQRITTPQKESYNVGDTVVFTCHHGYRLIGDDKSMCALGGRWPWVHESMCIELGPECFPRPAPLHGYVMPDKEYFYRGSNITYSCKDGYKLVGIKKDECLDLGRWLYQKTPRCVQTSCSGKIPPENGDVKPLQKKYLLSQSVTFSCKKGYELKGNNIDTCIAPGKWAVGKTPTCVKLCSLEKVKGIMFYSPVKEYYEAGDCVKFGCIKMYGFKGRNKIKCQDDGTWEASVAVPKCVSRCYITKVVKLIKHYSVGEWIRYYCEKGYPPNIKYGQCLTKWERSQIAKCKRLHQLLH